MQCNLKTEVERIIVVSDQKKKNLIQVGVNNKIYYFGFVISTDLQYVE